MKLTISVCAVLLAAILVIPGPGLAEEPQGTIDWVNGFIVAVGQGTANPKDPKAIARLKALRAAEVGAQRALLEVVKGVRIDAQTTVKNMLLEEDIINTRVEGFLKGAMVTKREVEIVDGVPLATVEMKVCMTGAAGECAARPSLVGLLEIDRRNEPAFVPAERLVPAVQAEAAAANPAPPPAEPAPPAAALQIPAPVTPPPALPAEPQKAESPAPVPSPPPVQSPPQTTTASQPVYDPARPVTGIIVNLEGRYFEREVLPVIITTGPDKSLRTVYSVKSVNPSIVRTYGAVRYADNIDNARQIQAIGVNPLVISVEGVTRENMLVLRAQDAGLIKETITHGNNYLSDAKVVISIR